MTVYPIWTKIGLRFSALGRFENPYVEVEIWVDLEGPNFSKRVFGFWDGGPDFIVRVLATKPGKWTWRSGSTPEDSGLSGKRGGFEARAWTDDELEANPNRRGMIRASEDGRGLEYADGTPYRQIGTTCYAWTHQLDHSVSETLRTLRSAPFNKVRMCILPKYS
jgi:hypothetical protein